MLLALLPNDAGDVFLWLFFEHATKFNRKD
jgi:hypothetical protein